MMRAGRILASGLFLTTAAMSGAAVAQDAGHRAPDTSLEAGAAAALELLSPEAFEAADATPEALAGAVFEVMAPQLWQPIETAPRDAQILLGLKTDSSFRVALGQWEVRDEPVLDEMTGGAWSTATWWGTDPTHWAPLPPPPVAREQ